MSTARPRCARCGVLSVPLPGDVCGPCKAGDAEAGRRLLADLFASQKPVQARA